MATKRCSTCGINYPPYNEKYVKCLVCGDKTDHVNESDQHSDWERRVDEGNGVYKAPELPALHRDHLVVHNGQVWVAHDHLVDAGYPGRVRIGDIIRVIGYTDGSLFFEVNGEAMRLRGESEDTPKVMGWWLGRVFDEGWVPDAPPA